MSNMIRNHPLAAVAAAAFAGLLLSGSLHAIFSTVFGLLTTFAFALGCCYVIAYMMGGKATTSKLTAAIKHTLDTVTSKAKTVL